MFYQYLKIEESSYNMVEPSKTEHINSYHLVLTYFTLKIIW